MAEEPWETRFRRQVACSLCSEYFVQPTKLLECLHTFCRNCIVNHLENVGRTCPMCDLSRKRYERDIDRPHLARSLVPDISLDEIIKRVIPEEGKLCIIDTWFTSRGFTPPVRRIAHLTRELKFQHYCNSNEMVSVTFNSAEMLNFANSLLVPANTTINSVRKAIADKLSSYSQYSCKDSLKKITLSYENQKLEDDLTMIVIFVHYCKYTKVPIPLDLEFEL